MERQFMRKLSGVLDSGSSRGFIISVLFLPRGQRTEHVAQRQQVCHFSFKKKIVGAGVWMDS
jgi:hypothetical protein